MKLMHNYTNEQRTRFFKVCVLPEGNVGFAVIERTNVLGRELRWASQIVAKSDIESYIASGKVRFALANVENQLNYFLDVDDMRRTN